MNNFATGKKRRTESSTENTPIGRSESQKLIYLGNYANWVYVINSLTYKPNSAQATTLEGRSEQSKGLQHQDNFKMERHVALEALGAVCNAQITSVQNQRAGGHDGVFQRAAFPGSAAPMLSINSLICAIADGDQTW